MMASLFDVAVRRAGEGGFDKPVAALAGGAVAALLFLMPVDVLQNLVIDSGLPALLPPAEPPLGLKARAVLALVAGLVAFASAYGLMRLLGRGPVRSVKAEPDEEATHFEPPPRMRRRDLHPDAPIRAPISALRDLGHPGGQDEADAPLDLTEYLPELPPEPMADEDELILAEPEVAEASPEPLSVPEPEPVSEPEPEPAAEPTTRAQGEETIAELLARLERALEKKPLPQWLELPESASPQPQPMPQPVPANEETAEPMDARLRSALENLKRFAPAHG